MKPEKRELQKMWWAAVMVALCTGGCAGNGTVATGKIAAVERAISDAKAFNASVDAPAELRIAENELAGARAAMAASRYEEAGRLADKASADADYARSRAITAKSRKMADEVRESVKNLRQEIERMPSK